MAKPSNDIGLKILSDAAEMSTSPNNDTVPKSCQQQQFFNNDDQNENFSTTSAAAHKSEEEIKMDRVLAAIEGIAVNDAAYQPRPFTGKGKDADATESWLEYFDNYSSFRGITGDAKLRFFKLLLTEAAADWLRSLDGSKKNDYAELIKQFRRRFSITDLNRWQKASTMWNRQQESTESCDAFITDVMNMARLVPVKDETLLRFSIIKGLRPEVRRHVLQSGASTLQDVVAAARVAEAAILASGESTDVSQLAKQVGELVDQLKKTPPVAVVSQPPSQPRTPSLSPRRVHFDEREDRRDRRAVCAVDRDERNTSADRRAPAPPTQQFRRPRRDDDQAGRPSRPPFNRQPQPQQYKYAIRDESAVAICQQSSSRLS